MEIYSKGEYPANILSNFAPNSFIFDGIECASMEGFLQSLKFRNQYKQIKVCSLIGKEAKKIGSKKFFWKITGIVWWKGKKIKRSSPEFENLLADAYKSLYLNPQFRAALESTQGEVLSHSMGKHNKRKTILTEEEFITLLDMLRNG